MSLIIIKKIFLQCLELCLASLILCCNAHNLIVFHIHVIGKCAVVGFPNYFKEVKNP